MKDVISKNKKRGLIHIVNGKLVPENKLLISPRDLGLQRGFAVFDFLITYNNKPFMIDEHIQRLIYSASMINLYNPWTKEQIKEMIDLVIKANDKNFEKNIKLILTGGESGDGFTPEGKTKIIILIDKFAGCPKDIYKKGVSLIATQHRRYLPSSKTSFYTEAIRNLSYLKEKGAFEILYYDSSQVYECSRSNIFALINGQLITPKNHILPGITRKIILEKLKLGITVTERDFTLQELFKAKEVFITKSNEEIVPVVKIDDQKISANGEITKRVIKEFKKFTQSEDWWVRKDATNNHV